MLLVSKSIIYQLIYGFCFDEDIQCFLIEFRIDNLFAKEKLFNRASNEIKYKGYIAKQQREVEGSKKNEKTKIPKEIDYSLIKGLSNEVVEKLKTHKPTSLGQASRLEGITPAAINLLAITIKKNQLLEKA